MDFREWGEGRISRRQQSIKGGDHRKLTTANVGGITKITELYWGIRLVDQYQYMGNCPPTPPLTQH